MAIHRRLADEPADHAALAREVAARGHQALDQLERGLAGYGANAAC